MLGEVAILGPNCPAPRPAWLHVNGATLGLWFLQQEKENPWWASSFLSIPGPFQEMHSGLISWGSLGDLWSSITEDQRATEKGGNQHSDLGKSHSCLQQHASTDPSQQLCPSGEPSWWPHLARELSCLIWILSQQTI